jgi:peptide deformylase
MPHLAKYAKIDTMKSKYTRDDIITLPNSHLRQRSNKVREITNETRQLIDDMLAATLDWEESRPHEVAVALAAVQIDRLERVVIVREDFENKENKNFIVLINPEIVKKEGEIITDHEGCLSVKDVYGQVPRHEKVRVRAIDITGHEIRLRSPNPFIARILQHEIDHTNGICFVDHIADQKKSFFILTDKGDLEPYSYEKVVQSGILPDD